MWVLPKRMVYNERLIDIDLGGAPICGNLQMCMIPGSHMIPYQGNLMKSGSHRLLDMHSINIELV